MKNNSFGKRVTVADIEKKRHSSKVDLIVEKAIDEYAFMIDEQTDKAVVDVINSLGYSAAYGMSLEEAQKVHDLMKQDGITLNIHPEQLGTQYKVTVSVVQVARELLFDLEDVE